MKRDPGFCIIPEEVLLRVFVWLDISTLRQFIFVNRYTYELITTSGVIWHYANLRKPRHRSINNILSTNPAIGNEIVPTFTINTNEANQPIFYSRILESHLIKLFNGWLDASALHAVKRIRLDGIKVASNVLTILLARCPQLEWLSLRHSDRSHCNELSNILTDLFDQGKLLKLRYVYDTVMHYHTTQRFDWQSNSLYSRPTNSTKTLEILQAMASERQEQQQQNISTKSINQLLPSSSSSNGSLLKQSDNVWHSSHNTFGLPSITGAEQLIEVWPMPCDACSYGYCIFRRHWCELCSQAAYLCKNCCQKLTCYGGCGSYRCNDCRSSPAIIIMCPGADHPVGFLCNSCHSKRSCQCTEIPAYCHTHKMVEHSNPLMNNINCRRCGRWICVTCNKTSVCRCRPGVTLCNDCGISCCVRCNLSPTETDISWVCNRCNRYMCVKCNDRA